MTPSETPLDPTTLKLLVIISLLCLAAYCARQAHHAMRATRMTEDQRNRVEAQKLMLRFCTNPTKRNYDMAWDFIYGNEIVFGDLHWPLVQRFTRTAVTAHFSTMEAKT